MISIISKISRDDTPGSLKEREGGVGKVGGEG
jgi:hypothetical protein